jgi:hypothetical protein
MHMLPAYLLLSCADGVTYMPVTADSYLFRVAAAWQFPAFAICLGSSYLQRMMEKLPQMALAILSCPGFEDYSAFLNNRVSRKEVAGRRLQEGGC